MGHSVNGRNLVGMISGWMVIKGVLNLILGFGIGNIITLLVSIALGYLMLKSTPFMNYVTAILLFGVVIANIKNNIVNFEILYLIEAAVDVACGITLFVNKDVKEFFGQNN